MAELHDNEYASFYKIYVDRAFKNGIGILKNLEDSYNDAFTVFENLPEEKHEYRYAPDKWTIKELLQHLIDTERVFAYRALRFSRNDTADLQGFDQTLFAANCDANIRPFDELLDEFSLVRRSTIILFRSFSEDMLLRCGTINNNTVSVRAKGYIISGHLLHHLDVIKERYL